MLWVAWKVLKGGPTTMDVSLSWQQYSLSKNTFYPFLWQLVGNVWNLFESILCGTVRGYQPTLLYYCWWQDTICSQIHLIAECEQVSSKTTISPSRCLSLSRFSSSKARPARGYVLAMGQGGQGFSQNTQFDWALSRTSACALPSELAKNPAQITSNF